jgi:LmbE family N-acetylglucosaminyl deacetylase
MLRLELPPAPTGTFSILAVGAHPDDIEIGSGGALLSFAASQQDLRLRYVVLTGAAHRQLEARQAARAFVPSADIAIDMLDLPEGRLPSAWAEVKNALESVRQSYAPDLILSPSPADAHQDHRTIGEIMPTVFRDHLCLSYEIPKWDGDMARPSVYIPMSAEVARRKVDLLHKCFPSQHGRDWWDDEVFLGLARLRGMECRAPYAEAFTCSKLIVGAPFPGLGLG